MSTTTQGITGSLRAACSEPVLRFLACPFQLTKTDAPNTRVSLPPRALLATAGRLLFIMERTHLLTSFQDFGLAAPISRALKEEHYLMPPPLQPQPIPPAVTAREIV